MPISVSVDTSGFQKRASEYVQRLKETMATEMPLIALEMAQEVHARTPSRGQEYEEIMGGSEVGLAGDRSNDQDTYKDGTPAERIRFMRSPGVWLEELVLTPGIGYIVTPGELMIGLGVVSALESSSRFSWQNYSKKLGAMQHQTAGGVWSYFEYGYAHTSTPQFGSKNYYLRPDELTRVPTMTKNYPAFRMYAGFDKSTFIEAVKARIMDVQF